MSKKLKDFKPTLPLIRSLCNPGMMDRHKLQIAVAVFGTKIVNGHETTEMFDSSTETVTSYIVHNKLNEKKDLIEDISDKASKEFSNMRTMDKMKTDWEPLIFEALPCAGKDSYILGGEAVELITTALDDHIIKTQTMKGSPFAKFMLPEIEKWETTLMRTQENLELWLKVQATWMYLEPVFSSEDIINQMPVEGQKFKEVNIAWHNLMERIHA